MKHSKYYVFWWYTETGTHISWSDHPYGFPPADKPFKVQEYATMQEAETAYNIAWDHLYEMRWGNRAMENMQPQLKPRGD